MPRKGFNKPISPAEIKLIKMFEFVTDYTASGISVFLSTAALPDIAEFAYIMTQLAPSHEVAEKVKKSSTTTKEQILVEQMDKYINEPIRIAGGLDCIRKEFAIAKKEEAESDKLDPYRINRYEILESFYRLGGYGTFANLTTFCMQNGIDIRTAYRKRHDIFRRVAHNLVRLNSKNDFLFDAKEQANTKS